MAKMTPDELRFWQSAFITALGISGTTGITAENIAWSAVESMRKEKA